MKKNSILKVDEFIVIVCFLFTTNIVSEASTKKVALGNFENGAKSRYGSLACTKSRKQNIFQWISTKNKEIMM